MKTGSYVRCPNDYHYPDDPRIFLIGQILEIDEYSRKVKVIFHDIDSCREYYSDFPEEGEFYFDSIEHWKVLDGSKIKIINSSTKNSLSPGEAKLLNALLPNGFNNWKDSVLLAVKRWLSLLSSRKNYLRRKDSLRRNRMQSQSGFQ